MLPKLSGIATGGVGAPGSALHWTPFAMLSSAIPAPSATVVLLRDGATGIEVLMVKRSADLAFHGGAWVFPGGRVDPVDRAGNPGEVEAARAAAVRELREEAGLDVHGATLVPFAEWITPEGRPRRFRTWFFAAQADGLGAPDARVDGGEITEHQWVSPERALEEHRLERMDLPPPTFVTLTHFADHARVGDVLVELGARGIVPYHPRPRSVAGGIVALYQGDAAYEGGELDAPGPRHRLVMVERPFRYERRA